jgi:sialate O-acetylesterase
MNDQFRDLTHRPSIVCAVILFFLAAPAWADPSLPHLFSDHMVLQREREVPIWGKADPGERIEVRLAEKSASTSANNSGDWSLHLPAMHAGGPFTLTIIGKKTITIKDVLIGEVWIGSGQSNMAFNLSRSTGSAEEIPKADYPNIRLFQVPKRDTPARQSDTLAASWQICTSDSSRYFSAVAYYFARNLHRALNVPIGMIESDWSGTAIEEWIAPEQAQRVPQIQPMLDAWNHSEGNSFAPMAPFDLQFDDFELIPKAAGTDPKRLVDFNDGTTHTAFGGGFSYDWKGGSNTAFDLATPGRGGAGFAAHVSGNIDVPDESHLIAKFHWDGSPVDLSAYSGIRFWVRGMGRFRLRTLQPTINDWDDYSSVHQNADPEWKQVTVLFQDLHQDGWGVVEGLTPFALAGFALEVTPVAGDPHRPATGLYQAMIAPLAPYAFRGAIWYQGESNALKAQDYRTLLPGLIQSWRVAWNQRDMPFLVVQLPNHGSIPEQPGDSAWAELREAQLHTLQTVPHTGLAVTIDIGDPKDIHPHRKAEVGERLALWALATTYQQKLVYSGPLYDSMRVEGGAIRIRFTHVGTGLLAKDGSLRGFAIAGADRKFHWATATVDGDSIVVSSPEVAAPVAVRYAWGDSPECNLFNREGLPASPFRTDSWPGITGPR